MVQYNKFKVMDTTVETTNFDNMADHRGWISKQTQSLCVKC